VKGALYCAIPDILFRGAYAEVLRIRGYKFWNHEATTSEFIYYRWCNTASADRVPRYATSIEGGGLVVLSPDERRVLCVYEYGRWGCSGGAVEYSETSLQAALRESHEETGVQIDDSFPLYLAGGWNLAAARDNLINDHFLIYVSRALHEGFNLDQHEITDAKWVELDLLKPLLV
jgi:8-oxo-dGTP pyrophosphatase MutT (NUDIX family)